MDNFQILTLLVSIISVIIATVSLVRTNKFAKITSELSQKQLQIIEKEEKASEKAEIDVELIGGGGSHQFIVSNIGLATATDLNIAFEGGCPVVSSEYENKNPIKELRSGKSIEFVASRSMGSPPSYKVLLRWKNPNGEQVRDEVTVHW